MSFSQPLPTRRPSDRMDYHILYILYSAHTNVAREGGGVRSALHSGRKFKSAFYVNTRVMTDGQGGHNEVEDYP